MHITIATVIHGLKKTWPVTHGGGNTLTLFNGTCERVRTPWGILAMGTVPFGVGDNCIFCDRKKEIVVVIRYFLCKNCY